MFNPKKKTRSRRYELPTNVFKDNNSRLKAGVVSSSGLDLSANSKSVHEGLDNVKVFTAGLTQISKGFRQVNAEQFTNYTTTVKFRERECHKVADYCHGRGWTRDVIRYAVSKWVPEALDQALYMEEVLTWQELHAKIHPSCPNKSQIFFGSFMGGPTFTETYCDLKKVAIRAAFDSEYINGGPYNSEGLGSFGPDSWFDQRFWIFWEEDVDDLKNMFGDENEIDADHLLLFESKIRELFEGFRISEVDPADLLHLRGTKTLGINPESPSEYDWKANLGPSCCLDGVDFSPLRQRMLGSQGAWRD